MRQSRTEKGYSQPGIESAPDVQTLTTGAERLPSANLSRRSETLALERVVTSFGLDQFERDVVPLAVAPNVDLRYKVLYSYLNNDVTRKRPTCGLALRLFCVDKGERWSRRHHFAPDALLFR